MRTLPVRVLAFHVALLGFGCGAEPLKVEGPANALTDTAEAGPEEDPAEVVVPPGPLPAAARRLTDARYRASIEALLGVEYTGDLPLDYDLHGYVTVGAAGITVSPYDLEIYELAAWDVATTAIPDAESRDALMGCAVVPPPTDPDRTLDLGCVDTFLASLLERAWRRPPTTDELATMHSLFVEVHALSNPTLAARAAVAAAVLSPHFLYIVEVGTTDPDIPDERVLTEWELAQRLAFFVTDAPPDDELRAAIGTLTDPGVLEAHARRLLATDRGRAAMTRFFVETLDLNRLDTVDKDATLFPEDSPTLRAAMVGELEALWQTIALEEDSDIRLLLTTEAARVTPELAAIYGIDDITTDTWVTLPTEQARGGILGRAGFAALNATATRTSPTFRGKFVRMRMLCEDVPPPPEDVVASLEGTTTDGTLREQLEAHMNDPACLPCHQMMDPLGFGMEHLDPIGRWRDTDNGFAIDASGDLDGVPFTDARGLGAAVAADPRFGACMSRQLYRHALGGLEGERQETEVVRLATALADGGHKLSSLVVALVTSDGFLRVAAPTLEEECEQPGATRLCEASCGDGFETCLGGIWQGCTGTSAPHETCDGVDADCDDVIDQVVASCETGVATCESGTFSECAGPDRIGAETCDGIDNNGDGVTDGDHGVDHAMAIDFVTVSFDAVMAAHEGCDLLESDTTTGPCGAAANRVCANTGCGLATGFGPIAIDDVDKRATFACFEAERASVQWTTFDTLAAHHPWCSWTDPVSPDCNASINRECNARGLTTGFGSLEHGTEDIVIACTPTAEIFREPYDTLTAIEPGCAWPSATFNVACRTAMHDWCRDKGFATGHGPLENYAGDAWIACIPAAAEVSP